MIYCKYTSSLQNYCAQQFHLQIVWCFHNHLEVLLLKYFCACSFKSTENKSLFWLWMGRFIFNFLWIWLAKLFATQNAIRIMFCKVEVKLSILLAFFFIQSRQHSYPVFLDKCLLGHLHAFSLHCCPQAVCSMPLLLSAICPETSGKEIRKTLTMYEQNQCLNILSNYSQMSLFKCTKYQQIKQQLCKQLIYMPVC